MSLDVYLMELHPTEVFSANVTHNLNRMAMAAGIYEVLWHPDEHGITRADQMIGPLERGLAFLRDHAETLTKLDAPNGWGTYANFVPWVERYLDACRAHPGAMVMVSR